ncbi:MAG: hypothetical protein JW837_05210 [Sedimentisphaerales bacterium]|nr:hypothetical protein [Sedimentisphaerales bacterium]
MRYRPPKQLHASLYIRDKKRSDDSKADEEAEGKSVSNKKSRRAQK